jgi:hypothetical protein
MNEAGLSVNEHTLDLAVYQQPKAGVPNVCSGDLQSWALGLYATVAEVSTALKTVRVIGRGGGQWGFQYVSPPQPQPAVGASSIARWPVPVGYCCCCCRRRCCYFYLCAVFLSALRCWSGCVGGVYLVVPAGMQRGRA